MFVFFIYRTFDREKKSAYSFLVEAADSGIYDRRSEQVKVDITILDVNDNAPVFREVPYRKSIAQGTSAEALILTVQADDKDAGINKVVTYILQADARSQNFFKIDSTSGVIRTKVTLGSDAVGYHNLKVLASDSGVTPLSTTG